VGGCDVVSLNIMHRIRIVGLGTLKLRFIPVVLVGYLNLQKPSVVCMRLPYVGLKSHSLQKLCYTLEIDIHWK